MEIKDILEKLQTRFEGVSAAVLQQTAKKLAKTVTDDAAMDTAIEGLTIQQVIDSYTDYRVSDGIASHEKKAQQQQPQKQQEPPIAQKAAPAEMPEWAKGLYDTLNSQAELIKSLQQDKIASGRNAKINDALKNLPASVRARYEKDLSRLSFKDDDDFNAWLEDAKGDFNTIETQLQQQGAKFQAPLGGAAGGKKQTEADKEMAKSVAQSLIKNK